MTEKPGLRSLFILLWPIVVLIAYYHHSWPHFDSAAPLFPAAWPTFEALGRITRTVFLFLWTQAFLLLLGRALRTRSPWRRPSRLANLLISYGLGTGLLMGVLFLLAILGFYSAPILVFLFLICTAGAILANEDLMRPSSPKASIGDPWAMLRTMTFTEKALSALIAAYGIVFLFHALTPETSYDALVYHLGFPNLWLNQHRFKLPLTYCFSGMPLNMELLYGLALSLSDDVLAKLMHYGFGAASLAAMYLIVREYASRASALLAVVIFLAAPMVALDFLWAATDLPAVFFGLMAGYALVVALPEHADDRRWVGLAGLFCGLGMGCKYPAWIVLPALVVAWFWQTRRVRQTVWILLISCLAVGPWCLKNGILFHNPMYPFFSHIVNWEMLRAEAGRNFSVLFTLRGFLAYLVEPWSATMGTTSRGNYLGPALLMCLPVILSWPRTAGISFWRKLSALEWLLVSVLSYMPRFWYPSVASLAVLIGLSFDSVRQKILKAWVTILVIVVGGLNLFWIHRYFMPLEGWKVTFGNMPRAEYLKKSQPHYETPYYPAVAFINSHAPADAKVLLLGDTRSYYLERSWIGASLFDAHPFYAWANEAAGGDALYERLRQEGLSWVLFNPAEATRMQSYWMGQVTPHGRDVIAAFWSKHVQLMFNDVQIDKKEYRADAVLLIVPALPPKVAPLPNVIGEILRQK